MHEGDESDLVAISGYWWLLVAGGSWWQLVATSGYWSLLMAISGY